MYEGTLMADDVMIKEDLTNPCCIVWRDKYNKLKDSYTKIEDRRNALHKVLSIYEEQVSKIQAENLFLRKDLGDEKVRTNNEKGGKDKGICFKSFFRERSGWVEE